MVWQDMPSGDAGRNAESKANYRRELQAMIDALRNHPSIVMWVPFNEGWGQHDTPEVVEWIEKYDPTRPVNEASGWHDKGSGDVSDMHNYPGPGMRPPEAKRVSVLGEFGGLGMPVSGPHLAGGEELGLRFVRQRRELTDAYVELLTTMRPLIGRGLSAAVYTQTSDVEIEVNGLMTYDRERREDGRRADRGSGAEAVSAAAADADAGGDEREDTADVAIHDDRARGRLAAGRFRRQRVEGRPGRFWDRGHAGRGCAHRLGVTRTSGCGGRSSWIRCRKTLSPGSTSTTTRCRRLSQRQAGQESERVRGRLLAGAARCGSPRRCWHVGQNVDRRALPPNRRRAVH